MAVWSTRQDHRDPAALIHATPPDAHGRTLGPVCGATGDGMWLAAEVAWDDVATTARCAACAAALQRRPAGP